MATRPWVSADRLDAADLEKALTSESGTLTSDTNKIIDAGSVAENTASKVIRRKADSNITVPTTPTDTTDAASKAYADTKSPASGILGAWTARQTGSEVSPTVFQAATDLIIMIGRDTTTSRTYKIYTDSANPPTTLRGVTITDASGFCGLSVPVKKNDYYKIVVSSATGAGEDFDTIAIGT